MPLHLMPGESVIWTSTVGRNVAGWRDDDDAYITVTSQRLALTYSDTMGGQSGAQYLPLERIDSVTQSSSRKDFTKGWVIALILGLVACVVPGLIVLLVWFLSRNSTLTFTAGGGRMQLYTDRLGGAGMQLELIDIVEGARQALLRQPPPSAPVRVTLTP